MAPLAVPPSLANSSGVPSPASIMRASMVPFVDGLMGAAAIRILNAAGETALASAETGSHILRASKGSTLTLWIPISRNFLAAHSIARSQAAEPVGRPPIPSESSRRSVISGVSPCARAASWCGGSCANRLTRDRKQAAGGRIRAARLPIRIIPINHSLFHHEGDLFNLSDVLDRVAGDNDNIR